MLVKPAQLNLTHLEFLSDMRSLCIIAIDTNAVGLEPHVPPNPI